MLMDPVLRAAKGDNETESIAFLKNPATYHYGAGKHCGKKRFT